MKVMYKRGRNGLSSKRRLLSNRLFSAIIMLAVTFGAVDHIRAETAAELAKKLANPIASMISVPFQFNYDQGYGTADGDQWLLNFQPVIPISISDDWNLITRTIIPIKNVNDIFGQSGNQFGLGDTTMSLWLSPKEPSSNGIIWGVGPIIYLPTSTDNQLGPGKWGAGPTVVALKQIGHWTIGGLANQVWSFDDDTINSFYVQPFLSYTTPDAWTFSLNTESAYNWNSEEWSVPVNFMVSKLVHFGKQPVQFQGGIGYYAASTTGGADDWRARFQVTFLFPKGG